MTTAFNLNMHIFNTDSNLKIYSYRLNMNDKLIDDIVNDIRRVLRKHLASYAPVDHKIMNEIVQEAVEKRTVQATLANKRVVANMRMMTGKPAKAVVPMYIGDGFIIVEMNNVMFPTLMKQYNGIYGKFNGKTGYKIDMRWKENIISNLSTNDIAVSIQQLEKSYPINIFSKPYKQTRGGRKRNIMHERIMKLDGYDNLYYTAQNRYVIYSEDNVNGEIIGILSDNEIMPLSAAHIATCKLHDYNHNVKKLEELNAANQHASEANDIDVVDEENIVDVIADGDDGDVIDGEILNDEDDDEDIFEDDDADDA